MDKSISDVCSCQSGWLLVAAVCLLAVAIVPQNAYGSGFLIGDGNAAPAGQLWVKASYQSWRADQVFAGIFDRSERQGVELGDPIPFDRTTGGQLDSQAAALSLRAGLVPRLEMGGYFPAFQQTTFADQALSSTTTGTGDVWGWVAYQLTPSRAREESTVATKIGLQFKIPTTTVPVELESVPISEGQFDLALEQATTLAVGPDVQLTLKTLLRRRFALVDGDRVLKPGDEAEVGLSAGWGAAPWLWLSGQYAVLWSTGFENRSGGGPVTLRSKRQVQEVLGSAYLEVGQLIDESLTGLAIDAWLAYPVSGRDYPRGLSWGVGLAWQTQMWRTHQP